MATMNNTNNTRRDLLRRFGVGAIIAPIIGGAADTASAAELIEVPHVRPVELFTSVPKPIAVGHIRSAKLILEMSDGQSRMVDIPYATSTRGDCVLAPDRLIGAEVEFRDYRGSPAGAGPFFGGFSGLINIT